MTMCFERGSEWRKWDLHVHLPGTKLSNGYGSIKKDSTVLDQFCTILHNSDVQAFGLTDYFALDTFFLTKDRYSDLFPHDNKLFIPNLELRLTAAVNSSGQVINIHLLFNPNLEQAKIKDFMRALHTSETAGRDSRSVSCDELSTEEQFEKATVDKKAIEEAIKATFGPNALVPEHRQQYLLVIVSAKGDGIRPSGPGLKRKELLTDEIDKFSDAVFANENSRNYFLDVNRLETDEKVKAKPVFDGSDAHSFEDLNKRLGKSINTDGDHRNVLWIKADLTYNGLLQTLVEPEDRVALQPNEPDEKYPYHVIDTITFSENSNFSEKIVLNKNLNSIIGSRSSGKSALLAHIAHAVDPDSTVETQQKVSNIPDKNQVGPAAGYTWAEVPNDLCQVKWLSGSVSGGRVIYIPQNDLYSLSEKPKEITSKIRPILFNKYPDVKAAYEAYESQNKQTEDIIETSVKSWFSNSELIKQEESSLRNCGDSEAISKEISDLNIKLNSLKSNSLSDNDVKRLQDVLKQIADLKSASEELGENYRKLRSAFHEDLNNNQSIIPIQSDTVAVHIDVKPVLTDLPNDLVSKITELKTSAAQKIKSQIEQIINQYASTLEKDIQRVKSEINSIQKSNSELINRDKESKEILRISEQKTTLKENIKKIDAIKEKIKSYHVKNANSIQRLTQALEKRRGLISSFERKFDSASRELEELTFTVETGIDSSSVEQANHGFNRRSTNDYIQRRGDDINYSKAQGEPAAFLKSLFNNSLEVNKGYEKVNVAIDVFKLSDEIRFGAVLDNDHIGGFEKSSMTPGKQALFALTLILSDSDEPWPLLIDQPEDDLDSRSIYNTIVPYLVKSKKKRQIIMVTHNANLVIGADSEEVIVANRHGEDRKNANHKLFSYLSGSLEYSKPNDVNCQTVLEKCGIREHACEILDGGAEAFQKREEKYKLI